jgi:hypothetical protein
LSTEVEHLVAARTGSEIVRHQTFSFMVPPGHPGPA